MPIAVDSERKETNWLVRVGNTPPFIVQAYSEFDARVRATHRFKQNIALRIITAEPCDEVDSPIGEPC